MSGFVENTQIFRWQRQRLHLAPEGLVLEHRKLGSPRAQVVDFKRYEEVEEVKVERRWRRAVLVVRFPDSVWRIGGLPLGEAEWAAELIREQQAIAYRFNIPEFREPQPFSFLVSRSQELARERGFGLIELLDLLAVQGVYHGASDIHFDPVRDGVRVRYRIDGVLQDVVTLPMDVHPFLLVRCKVLAGLAVHKFDAPQEGRMRVRTVDRDVDVRITILPTLHGEKVCLRIFDPSRRLLKVEQLGFRPEMLQSYLRLLQAPQGMILLTGPANSGKTTTIYASLLHLHEHRKNLSSIVTVEDPIEHDLQVIHQTQVKPEAGLTFAVGLRTLLRQDPEVIMVGEIRDPETAEIATRAGLTGHLIFSTIHAPSAVGVFPRLIELGVPPFLVASSVTAVLAERLVRRICPQCKEEAPASQWPAEQRERYGIGEDETLLKGAGCEACRGTGYAGRIALFEMVRVDEPLREAIVRTAPVGELERIVRAQGVPSLKDDGVAKVREGITTLDELDRVLGPEG